MIVCPIANLGFEPWFELGWDWGLGLDNFLLTTCASFVALRK